MMWLAGGVSDAQAARGIVGPVKPIIAATKRWVAPILRLAGQDEGSKDRPYAVIVGSAEP